MNMLQVLAEVAPGAWRAAPGRAGEPARWALQDGGDGWTAQFNPGGRVGLTLQRGSDVYVGLHSGVCDRVEVRDVANALRAAADAFMQVLERAESRQGVADG